jgi:type IV pilus assembly protein PilA
MEIAIISFWRFREMGKKGFTLIELMIVVAIIGILAAIAIPNFLNFRGKAVQAEAKVNLGGIFVCQESYFSEYNTYGGGDDAFVLIQFIPISGKNRYTYLLDTDELTGSIPVNPKPTPPPVTKLGFTAIAVANIDNDPFIDFWMVNDKRDILNNVVDASGNITGNGSDLRQK